MGTPIHPRMYLVITNISKRPNVRALLSSAAAFGCEKVLVVGQPKFDMDPEGSDLPAALKEATREGRFVIDRFDSWGSCTEFLVTNGIKLVGVEIHQDALPIEDFVNDIHQDIAFLMGNEGQGLNKKQMDSCDAFVRIPQYGVGTASLNVYVAAGIILQRFDQRRRELAESLTS